MSDQTEAGRTASGGNGGLSASLAPMYRDDPRLVPLIGPGGRFEVEEIEVDGVRLRDFVRAPRTIVECFEMGAAHAEATHLVFEGERWSFARVQDGARRLARALRDDFGVGPGERVAIAMRNLPEFVVTFWGAALNGAIVVPLNAWWSGPELRYALENSEPRVVVVDEERRERIHGAGVPPGLAVIGVRGAGGVAFDDLLGAPPLGDDEIVRLGSDDPVTILYTSGTTGRPKGALGTNRGAIANLWNMAFVNAREEIISGRAAAPPSQAASLAAAPLFHIGGIAAIIGGQMGGSKMVMMPRWDVERAVELAVAEGVTNLGGVPAIARALFEYPGIEQLGLDVRSVPLGGAAVAPDLPLRAAALFGSDVHVFNGYGLTETTSAVVTNVGSEFLARPASVGRANLTADIKVVDPETGLDLGVGEVGEICMRSPQVSKGYWNDEAATAASFVDCWFHSGDLGRFDDDGYLYVVDRLKDVVIRGGENVYCAEVEAVLHEHPLVAEVAIVGIDDRLLGERVCAVVVPRSGADVGLESLRSFAEDRLAAFKRPEALLIVDEIPKTASGKVAKMDLRAQVAGDPSVEGRT